MSRRHVRLFLLATTAALAAAATAFAVTRRRPPPASRPPSASTPTGAAATRAIINGGPGTVDTWKVEFDLPAGSMLGSYWDALASQSGQHVTATNRSYNAPLPAGASAAFGFLVPGGGKPADCTVNGGPCGGGGGATVAPGAPTGLTLTGTTSSSVSLS